MFISSTFLGEEIKRLRKQASLSQKDLAKGVCTQAAISSIELGRTFPSIDILYAISIKLQFSIDQLMKVLTTSSHLYIQETMEHIDDLVKVNNYKEVFEITELNMKNNNIANLGNEFIQFIRWHNLLAKYYIGDFTYEECIKGLEELIGDNDNYQLKQSFQDLKIKNVIGNILTENKEYDKAVVYYEDILNREVTMEDYYKLKLKVYFNLSKLHFLRCDYRTSFRIADEGIVSSVKQEDISVLAHLYVQAGQALSMFVSKNEKERVLTYYHKAINLYSILDRDWYVSFVKDELIPLVDEVGETEELGARPTATATKKRNRRG